MRVMRVMSMFAGAALLAGCVGQDVELLNNTEAVGSPFTQQLAAEYRDLANFEAFEMEDWTDADFFARKGLAAAAGENVEPSVLADWDLPEEFVPELTDARARLVAALNGGAREAFPIEAAIAQAKFDCWVEQQEENHQPDHIAACRDEFYAALARLEELMAPGVPMAAPANFVIFFDWDSAVVGDQGQLVLDEAVAVALAEGITDFAVTGYTDSSGSADYNLGLSLRRAEAVAAGLETRGVPGQNISIAGRGEADQAVPTADGVRLQANRRVTIVLQ